MASRRKKVRQKTVRQMGPALIIALVLCVGVGAGVALRSYRAPRELPEPAARPIAQADESVQQEPEHPPISEEVQPHHTADAPQPEAEVAEEPTPGEEPAPPTTAEAPDSAADAPPSDAEPEAADATPAPQAVAEEPPAEPQSPGAEAEPEEPSEPQSAADEEPPGKPAAPTAAVAGSPQPEPANPYAGEYSLLGRVTPDTQRQWSSMVSDMLKRGDPELFAAELEKKIDAALPALFSGERFKYNVYSNSANLVNAVEFCFMAKALGEKKLKELFSLKDMEVFFTWMALDKSRPLHRLLCAYKLNSGVKESLPHALKTLYDIWRCTPNDRERTRYMNLALACSLVHPAIAESRGMIRDAKEVLLTMPEVYDFYRTRDSGRMLRGGLDLKKLSVSALLHVVDARLPRSEYEWVHKSITLSRDKWKLLYSGIDYRMSDAVSKDTPSLALYTSYTFDEIRKKGGVCREQAYYTATTAKCAGIPAVIITGDGPRSGHAWVGLMISERAWQQVGSYGYNTGFYVNPCSNKPEHESTLLNADKALTEARLESAADAMLLSELLMLCGKQDAALNAARYVNSSFPSYVVGWRHRVEMMEAFHKKQPLAVESWKQLRSELERNIGKNSELVDLAQEVDVNYLMGNLRDAVKLTALKRGYKRLTTPMTGRVDLLLDCIARQANIYISAGNKRDAVSFYRQMFKEHRNRGDIYALLVKQCAKVMDESDTEFFKALARDAETNYAKLAFNNTDYFKSRKDAEVMLAIVELYRLAGDAPRAIRIESETEEKMKTASLNAVRSGRQSRGNN